MGSYFLFEQSMNEEVNV